MDRIVTVFPIPFPDCPNTLLSVVGGQIFSIEGLARGFGFKDAKITLAFGMKGAGSKVKLSFDDGRELVIEGSDLRNGNVVEMKLDFPGGIKTFTVGYETRAGHEVMVAKLDSEELWRDFDGK